MVARVSRAVMRSLLAREDAHEIRSRRQADDEQQQSKLVTAKLRRRSLLMGRVFRADFGFALVWTESTAHEVPPSLGRAGHRYD